ncbi:DUF1697 domain-containing protein [Altericroceibacterium endophyticum]|uniref:DUF1697 domain-containing protein n=1 Tax=Altericroceibacterium endophyticum TaxID=1808508 RepID=A0A6I4T5W8_9SPHN|nr:DUF1697 domain-containing protein [Altericroceibacterium endophyticum]MXO66296.1 DUF1697 domain-containing protein [Altericroceibacterium endophyticum]
MHYIALFGSVNVGGNRLKMTDLRDAMEREDFENVETVIASGNVLFTHEERPVEGLNDKLAYVMQEHFDIDCLALVLTRDQLRTAIEENPFAADGDEKQVHTHFLEMQPSQEQFDAMVDVYSERGPERLALGTKALFVDYVEGVGRSRLTGPFIERRLDTRNTARNISSLKRILAKMPA